MPICTERITDEARPALITCCPAPPNGKLSGMFTDANNLGMTFPAVGDDDIERRNGER